MAKPDLDGVRKALEAHAKAQLPKAKKTRAKRNAPEKAVEKEVKAWLEKQGFYFTIIEAKASTAYKSYGMRAVPAGFPDIVGVSPQGRAVYIELKAPQNKNGLSDGQFEFLSCALEKKAFAVHTWSVEDLQMKYQAFLRGEDLRKFLPRKMIEKREEPLFKDLMPSSE